ncbi:glycosyltransferase [Rubinisphaera sp.]|uniref:glycosyltransferase n=1 Tax=Rubinisphaera sp. TaxID=2024857 RepID=UPI000C1127DD|nr:glycosyltransferase [Rubinisphaera sp.]MBV08706.1 lipopolysaccharide biosynthesis protein [Rubinisphaera sp.]HCS53188.1 lipopolysaccharide biosynthesis protein [Planctomycetaceae bacterium]|tara:strand:- start:717 stop:1856 length:1140 start_codon:yes stop_codon:yes gene_type:complete
MQITSTIPTISKSGTSPKIRVCHVSMCLTTGGLERLLVEFAKRSNRDQFETMFVALSDLGQPAEEIRDLGCPVLSLKSEQFGRLKQGKALRKVFAEQQIDVVHSHNTYAHFYASLAARSAGIPVVINTQHGRGCGNHWKQRAHFFIANRYADRVLAVSEDSARICRKQDPLSKSKIEPLWNGIDVDRFAFSGPVHERRAISVARLSPEKDFPTLLNATRLVVDQYPDFQLTLVGDGVERQKLETLTRELKLTQNVTFLGERRDIPDLLAQSSMFVSSSSTEGISLTLLEAMAVGLPIITTAVGGNPEIVQPETTGYLVPAGDTNSLAGAICNHLSQPDTWSAMGTVARHFVEQKFHIDRMVKEYELLYRSLVSESWGKI